MKIYKSKVRKVKVKWIEFQNLKTGLKINRINFYEDITLLVGLSGVGKSQILNAVEYSLRLAISKKLFLNPYEVNMGIDVNGNIYEWSYKIEQLQDEEYILNDTEQYYFTYEKLLCNNQLLFERNNEELKVIGYDKVPKPKKDESLLIQYAENESFEELIDGIRKLYPIEMELEVRGRIDTEDFSRFKGRIKETIEKYPETNFKTFSHLPVILKVYVAKTYYPHLYIKIFDAVKELFMEIDDIDVLEDKVRECFWLAIKVYGKTIYQNDISNGMLKSIYYIVELITMSEDSLVLIDEFENGLGVNCIDLLSEMFLTERTDLQFIITSHHPKIINQISKNRWKIIDRDVDVVMNTDSSTYGVGNSQHDAYFNLINRWEFEGKI